MFETTSKNKISYAFNIAYFGLGLVQTIAELFELNHIALTLRVVLPILLLSLYHINSTQKNILFYIIMGLLLLSNILFFYTNQPLFFYGVLAFLLLRILSLVQIFKLTMHINYLHITVATFPFLLIFFYLISATNEISELEFNLLIVQSILISLLGGISVVNYFENDNRQHSWLLISTLLFVGLRFIVFIERYFIFNASLTIYRPIGIILTIFAFYTFYKYVIAAESEQHKHYTTKNYEP